MSFYSRELEECFSLDDSFAYMRELETNNDSLVVTGNTYQIPISVYRDMSFKASKPHRVGLIKGSGIENINEYLSTRMLFIDTSQKYLRGKSAFLIIKSNKLLLVKPEEAPTCTTIVGKIIMHGMPHLIANVA